MHIQPDLYVAHWTQKIHVFFLNFGGNNSYFRGILNLFFFLFIILPFRGIRAPLTFTLALKLSLYYGATWTHISRKATVSLRVEHRSFLLWVWFPLPLDTQSWRPTEKKNDLLLHLLYEYNKIINFQFIILIINFYTEFW